MLSIGIRCFTTSGELEPSFYPCLDDDGLSAESEKREGPVLVYPDDLPLGILPAYQQHMTTAVSRLKMG